MSFLRRLRTVVSKQSTTVRRRRPFRRTRSEQLEDRVLLSAPDANNILVSQEANTGENRVSEYTLDGTLVQTFEIEFGTGGGYPATEYVRDIALDEDGDIQIYNGTFAPFQTELNPVTGEFTHRTFAEFSTANVISYGGLTVVGDFVFATDTNTANAESTGLIRFNTLDDSAEAFSTEEQYIDVEYGLDGKLYAVRSGLETEVDVFNPETVELLETIVVARGIRSVSVTQDGQLYGTNWSDDTLYHFDRDGAIVKQLELTRNPHDVNIRQDGTIIVGSSSGAVHVTTTALSAFTSFDLPGERTNFVAFAVPTPQPGFTVIPTEGSTEVSEDGSTDTFTVSLNAQPDLNVFVNVLTDESEITGAPVTLTFTPENWDSPQTVTLTGVADSTVDGDQTIPITVSVDSDSLDPIWANAADVVIEATNIDVDVADVDIVESGDSTTVNESGTGTSDSVTIRLPSRPLTDVTFELTTEITDLSLDPAVLIFTPDNWDTPQVVAIDAVDNEFVDGERTLTIDLTAADGSDPAFVSVTSTISITSVDDDVAEVSVTETGGGTQVSESDATDTVSIVLDARPRNPVRFSVTPDAHVTADAEFVTFTSENWNVPQPVTLAGADDEIVEGNLIGSVTFAVVAAESDEQFQQLADRVIQTTVLDDDVAGFTVTQTEGATVVSEGDLTDSFQVVLNAAPLTNVVLTIATDESEVGLSSSQLTFTPENWNEPQTVEVTGVEDNTVDGDQTVAAVISIDDDLSDDLWTNVADTSIDVTNQETDEAGLVISITGESTAVSEAGGTDSFLVSLPAQPLTNVIFAITTDTTVLSVDPTFLTFTPDNWNTAQTVTISGVDNDFVDGDRSVTIELSATTGSDSAFADVTETIEVVAIDDESAEIVATETGGTTVVSEAGETDTVSVVLSGRPRTSVRLAVTTDANIVADVEFLTFTSENWNTPQTITVSTPDNGLAGGNITSQLSLSVVDEESNEAFHDVPGVDIDVTVIDDETPSIIVTESNGTTIVSEDGDLDELEVALSAEPLSDVVIVISTSGTEVGVDSTQLVFTPSNWNTAQVVTVEGLDDIVVDGDQISIVTASVDASQSDPAWSGAADTEVSVTNLDNDEAGLTVQITGDSTTVSEDGNQTDTFSVSLSAQPLTSVTVVVTEDSARIETMTELVFDASNWNVPQVVTVTGADDLVANGDATIRVTVGTAASSDLAFQELTTTVDVVVLDDEIPAFTVNRDTLTVAEGQSFDELTVVLNVQPTGVVVIGHTADAQIEIGRSETSFTPENWNVPQVLSVLPIDDDVVEGGHSSSLLFFVDDTQSSEAFHDVADVTLNINIEDNETAGIVVEESDGSTLVTEDGAFDTISVSLNAQPVGNVTIRITSERDTDVTVASENSTVVFTPENWDQPVSVQVNAADDPVVDGTQQTGVTFSVVVDESHAAFATAEPVTVQVTSTDNDVAGFEIIESDGTTTVTEDGDSGDSIEVVLTAQPLNDVTFEIVGDGSEVSAAPSTLVFTSDNWNVPQVVDISGVTDDAVDGAADTILTVSINAGVSDSQFAAVVSQQVIVTTFDSDQHGDFDADGGQATLTDGILLLRHLTGFTGESLTNNAVNPSGRRTEPAAIAGFVDSTIDLYDIDADGVARTLTDGILYLRYLAGFRGEILIDNAVNQAGDRTSSAEIEAWLESIVNPPAPSSVASQLPSQLPPEVAAGPVASPRVELQRVETQQLSADETDPVQTAAPNSSDDRQTDSVAFTWLPPETEERVTDALFGSEFGIGSILDD